jgi:hypothetical protein
VTDYAASLKRNEKMLDDVSRARAAAVEEALKAHIGRAATLRHFRHLAPPVLERVDIVDAHGKTLARIETVLDGYEISFRRTDYAKPTPAN